MNPRGTEAIGEVHIAFALKSRHVAALEWNTGVLQSLDDGFERVADAPGGRRRFVGARELGLIDHDRRRVRSDR